MDPNFPVEKRNPITLGERYIIGLNELSLLDGHHKVDLETLKTNMPTLVNFYPDDDVLYKLVLKSIQLTDNWENELWTGFK